MFLFQVITHLSCLNLRKSSYVAFRHSDLSKQTQLRLFYYRTVLGLSTFAASISGRVTSDFKKLIIKDFGLFSREVCFVWALFVKCGFHAPSSVFPLFKHVDVPEIARSLNEPKKLDFF